LRISSKSNGDDDDDNINNAAAAAIQTVREGTEWPLVFHCRIAFRRGLIFRQITVSKKHRNIITRYYVFYA